MVRIKNKQTLIDGYSCLDICNNFNLQLKQKCFEMFQSLMLFYNKYMELPDNDILIQEKYIIRKKYKDMCEKREHGYYIETYILLNDLMSTIGNSLIKQSIYIKHEF